jgi:hypothetical protein
LSSIGILPAARCTVRLWWFRWKQCTGAAARVISFHDLLVGLMHEQQYVTTA